MKNIVVNRKVISFISILLFASIFFSCISGTMEKEAFTHYYDEHRKNYERMAESGSLMYKVSYLPFQLLAINEHEASKLPLDTLVHQYENAYYFRMEIMPKEGLKFRDILKSADNYSKMNHYLMSDLTKDFKLMINGRECKALLTNPETDIFMNERIRISISFERSILQNEEFDDFVFIYDDVLFNSGPLKFNFDSEDIQQINSVKIL